MTSAAQGGTTTTWQPPFGSNYNDGLDAIELAMARAVDFRDETPQYENHEVVFGGVVYNLSIGLGGQENNYYPWEVYRSELNTLLYYYKELVVEVYGGRFYLISTVIPRDFFYPEHDAVDAFVAQEVDYGLDLEADVCAQYAFCTMVEVSSYIKSQQAVCYAITSNPRCQGWYNNDGGLDGDGPHWAQRALNYIGGRVGGAAAGHGPLGSGSPFEWEVGVEVPQRVEWCANSKVPCPDDVRAIRLDVYDDAGTLVRTESIDDTLGDPDWTADFDGDADADWVEPSWASLGTAFLTFELFREEDPADVLLGRYVYVPSALAYGAGQTDFFRPVDAGGPTAVVFDVGTDAVRARPKHTDGPYFEDVFADGDTDAYVIPYNGDHYGTSCTTLNCPAGVPGFFLARLPDTAGRPDDTAPLALTFADEADVWIPETWGSAGALTWDGGSGLPGLVLAFPEGRKLKVGADLTAHEVTLTAAAAAVWGGVVAGPGALDFEGVTVRGAEVGVEVLSQGTTLTDVLLDGNGVGLLSGYVCPECPGPQPRSAFTLAESCVTGSRFVLNESEGYGIWARHTDATIRSSTVEGNDAYGLFVDEADVGAYRLLLQLNGDNSGSEDGARIDPSGDLTLTDLYAILGQNKILDNEADELFVEDNGYATVGISNGSSLRNHLAYGGSSTSGFIVDNEDLNTTIPALLTYWGDPNGPPAGSIDGLVNVSMWLSASPSGSAGRTGGCASAGADFSGGGGLIGGSSLGQGGNLPRGTVGTSPAGSAFQDPEPRTMDPAAAAWFRAQVDSLRLALAAAPDSPRLVRELYAAQRLDRDDELGERAETMALLGGLRGGLLGGAPLTESERAAGEAALVAEVHDALRAGRYAEASALLAPFRRGSDPLPEIEGDQARWTLALALVALDEQAGDLASAITRIEAVLAELGPEEEALARDLAATAALLARRLGGEGAGRQGVEAARAQAQASALPAAYALGQPYPNPSTGRTTLPLALPEAARVEVAVYDLLGRRVAVLADGPFEAGRHALGFDGSVLPSGVYVVRAVMEAERPAGGVSGTAGTTRAFTRRITLIR